MNKQSYKHFDTTYAIKTCTTAYPGKRSKVCFLTKNYTSTSKYFQIPILKESSDSYISRPLNYQYCIDGSTRIKNTHHVDVKQGFAKGSKVPNQSQSS